MILYSQDRKQKSLGLVTIAIRFSKNALIIIGFNYLVPGSKIIIPKHPAVFQKSLDSLIKNPKILNLTEDEGLINHEGTLIISNFF